MSDVDVAVIGAGAAGLGATRLLRAKGCKVALIEARSRIGGRAWTERTPSGQLFDHGASFIHVEDRNPWTAIARRLGHRQIIDPRQRYLFIEGRLAGPEDLERFMAARALAAQQVDAAAAGAKDCSLEDVLKLKGPFAPQARASLAPWLLGVDNIEASAVDFSRALSGEDRLLERGYGTLVESYGRGLEVQLETVAQHIAYGGERVEIVTDKGKLRARYAILTVPVGVLTAERIAFDPPLPAAKLAAIEGLPMGRLAKIGLFFDGDPFNLGESFYIHEQTSSEEAILYLARPAGADLVLAFIGGKLAVDLERASDDEAGAFALAPLLALFGHQVQARYRGATLTRWHQDPFALGSYAVARPGAFAARAILAAPLAGKLFFAGEAMESDGWAGTVAGSLISGRRAAMAITDSLRGAKDD